MVALKDEETETMLLSWCSISPPNPSPSPLVCFVPVVADPLESLEYNRLFRVLSSLN